ncbi:hypothetical protein GG344DRAFT_64961 [Lentinula edodes]|nr:hypothetical protein GG344DRAFT_64961 [Lentinula edodes]
MDQVSKTYKIIGEIESTHEKYFIRAYENVMRLPSTGISNVLVSVRKRSPLRDLQHDAYWMNAEAFLLTVDEMAIPALDVRYDKGEMELSWSQRVCGAMPKITASPIVAYGSKPLTSSTVPRSFRWSSTHRSLLTSFVAESGQNSAPGGAKRKAAKILSPRFPNEKVWLSSCGTCTPCTTAPNEALKPGSQTLSDPQNTLLAWDTAEGTYQGAQLTGSFTGVHPPGPSRLTPAELALTRPKIRRWLPLIVIWKNNRNHYISVMLRYFDNPRADGVWYLGKKVVGGVDGERGLTVDERVKLGIGMSFADVEARGRMRSIRNTWEMRMHVSLVPLASAAVAHFLLAEAVFLDLLDDPGCEVRGKRGNSCGG